MIDLKNKKGVDISSNNGKVSIEKIKNNFTGNKNETDNNITVKEVL